MKNGGVFCGPSIIICLQQKVSVVMLLMKTPCENMSSDGRDPLMHLMQM